VNKPVSVTPQATVAGLIGPATAKAANRGLLSVSPEEVGPRLERALTREKGADDPVARVLGESANGLLRALDLLRRRYHIVVTNPPFLLVAKAGDVVGQFCRKYHPEARKDLATCFVERCRAFAREGGLYALVNPQNWLFLTGDRKLREKMLRQQRWLAVARLGEHAFESPQAAGAFAALLIFSDRRPAAGQAFAGFDASAPRAPEEKAALLREARPVLLDQLGQLSNPDARVVLEELGGAKLLSSYSRCYKGITSGDLPRLVRKFWDVPQKGDGWAFCQSTVQSHTLYGGREHVLLWQGGRGVLSSLPGARIHGRDAWGKRGVHVSQMRHLPCSLYDGELWDNNSAPVVPDDPALLPAIWCFCSSPEYARAVRAIDQSLKVTNATLVQVPFDRERWEREAARRYPNGLPEPFSDDPTQWLFHGHPFGSVVWDESSKRLVIGPRREDSTVLQVAVARLLGYRWPAELDAKMRLAPEQRHWVERCAELLELADPDGIVCLPPVAGELEARVRLERLLAKAYGEDWSLNVQDRLLAAAGSPGKTLKEWLRDHFFRQHCALFHPRPFIWHIWDGLPDGFSALVNYHVLDRAKLEKLTHYYLGDWLHRQREAVERGGPFSEARPARVQ